MQTKRGRVTETSSTAVEQQQRAAGASTRDIDKRRSEGRRRCWGEGEADLVRLLVQCVKLSDGVIEGLKSGETERQNNRMHARTR
jgi:hypothetical protein